MKLTIFAFSFEVFKHTSTTSNLFIQLDLFIFYRRNFDLTNDILLRQYQCKFGIYLVRFLF